MSEISAIVPVYKVEPYIHTCLDSILAQTFHDFELILIDDGSPDNCGAICDAYAAKDDRVKVLHQQNGGLSAARNAGIDFATGEYLTFIDSDDYAYPTLFEELRNAILQTKADISICGFSKFQNNPEQTTAVDTGIHVIDGKQACMEIYRSDSAFRNIQFVTAWAKLYHANLFSNLRYPVGRIHEDEFTTYRTFLASTCVAIIEKQLYGYRDNPTGIMNSFPLKRMDDFDALAECIQFYREHGEDEIAECANKYLEYIIAKYSLIARKTKIFKKLPKPYQMNFRRAIQIMKDWKGIDYYEYEMIGLYPELVKLQAVLRNIRSLFP